jgi:hypothetical protein
LLAARHSEAELLAGLVVLDTVRRHEVLREMVAEHRLAPALWTRHARPVLGR